jgi:predicted MFS family arabinose efflux permease
MQAVEELDSLRRNARRVLAGVSTVAFATSLFSRAIDPIIPPIAMDLGVVPETVALLSTAFALPFALVQPILGPLADMFGKTRIMTVCLIILIATAVIGALAPSFQVLLVSRVLAGIAAGGVFPVSLAIVGDLVPVAERQIALGRIWQWWSPEISSAPRSQEP